MKKLSIVILNWNGRHFLEKFLPSVTNYSQADGFEVVIADNASTDDSIDFLKKEYPTIHLIQFTENYGFAGGYNEALKQLNSKYFLLLNSDVEVTPNWLPPLIECLDNDSSIACCMPKIHAHHAKDEFEYAGAAGGFIDKYGFPFCRGRVFNITEKDTGQYDKATDIFWATGAAMLIRSEVYTQLGGLDPDFFAHMEEIDLCWRVKNNGYRITCIPQSTVYHVGGGALPKENPFKTYLNFRNNLFLLYKNLDEQHLKKTLFKRKLLDGIAAIKFLISGEIGNFNAVVKAHFHYYKHLPQLKSKRKELFINKTVIEHKEMYNGSIVLKFFLKKKRHYSDIIID